MSNVPSAEVQLLLAAEKQATEKVTEARNRKNQRMKQAKEEAASEMEQFKSEKQLSFKQYEIDHIDTKDDIAKRIERETNERLEKLDERMNTTRDVVLKELIGQVVGTVEAKLHRNKKSMLATN